MNLVYGDCLKEIPKLPKVDLVLADMPYGTTRCSWDSPIDLSIMWKVLKDVRKERTPVILFAQTPFDKVLGCSNLPELKYEWIWKKTHPTGHLNAKKCPMKAHENVLVFYSKLPTYNPIKTQGHKRKTATKRGDKTPVYGNQTFESVSYDSTERYPISVQTFSSDKQKSKLHPTQKPIDFLEYLIKTYSNQGDVVLDFCMGSGSTGIAARNCDRNFIGIENDYEIFRIAQKRIEEAEALRANLTEKYVKESNNGLR